MAFTGFRIQESPIANYICHRGEHPLADWTGATSGALNPQLVTKVQLMRRSNTAYKIEEAATVEKNECPTSR